MSEPEPPAEPQQGDQPPVGPTAASSPTALSGQAPSAGNQLREEGPEVSEAQKEKGGADEHSLSPAPPLLQLRRGTATRSCDQALITILPQFLL